MKTPQELLIPRYKVIADYPNSVFKIGEILHLDKVAPNGKGWHQHSELEPIHLEEGDEKKYPAIFKKLEWWKEINEGDIPKYVKAIMNGENWYIKNQVLKVLNTLYRNGDLIRVNFEAIPNEHTKYHDINDFIPATEEEYLLTHAS